MNELDLLIDFKDAWVLGGCPASINVYLAQEAKSNVYFIELNSALCKCQNESRISTWKYFIYVKVNVSRYMLLKINSLIFFNRIAVHGKVLYIPAESEVIKRHFCQTSLKMLANSPLVRVSSDRDTYLRLLFAILVV